jgi:hypothetical protein
MGGWTCRAGLFNTEFWVDPHAPVRQVWQALMLA